MKGLFLFVLSVLCFSGFAQRISNTALYRHVGSQQYFRFHYENDYFSTTDIYYTQGINLEYVHPSLSKFFMSRLLIQSTSKEMKSGIALEHEGYTPTSISHNEILFGDRPFASSLFFKPFSIVNDAVRKERISSALSIGVIGPLAGGKEVQQTIHRWINDEQPLGWQNQIQNDIILNYQVECERRLMSFGNYFMMSAKAGVRAGTYNTNVSGGVILMLGYFDDPFTNFNKQSRKFQAYLYAEPLFNVVGYDATLQGGMFSNSPYVVSSGDINRLVVQGNAGFVFKINAVQLEYFQSYLTKEFQTGRSHMWGGVRIGWYVKR